MIAHVLSMISASNQVGWLVVLAIEILVMDFLARLQRSTENRFYHDDVFKHVAFRVSSWMHRHKNLAVAFLENEWLPFVKAVAFHGTEFRAAMLVRTSAALKANNRGTLWRCLLWQCRFFLTWRGSIGKHHIMSATVSLAKMDRRAPGFLTGLIRPHWLPLFGEPSPALPSTIANGIAKLTYRVAILLKDYFVAVGTVIFIHSLMISKNNDGNHFSLKFGGVE